jgi:hypothetical protein
MLDEAIAVSLAKESVKNTMETEHAQHLKKFCETFAQLCEQFFTLRSVSRDAFASSLADAISLLSGSSTQKVDLNKLRSTFKEIFGEHDKNQRWSLLSKLVRSLPAMVWSANRPHAFIREHLLKQVPMEEKAALFFALK